MRPQIPFSITNPLSARLGAVLDDWRALLRGQASMPFADDVDVAKLATACPNLFLLGVFDRPRRFRLDVARAEGGPEIAALAGRFLDEVDQPNPMAFLRSQAEATVESAQPTLYEQGARSGRPYGRLLLPAWGDGRISLLIGAVEFR
jgi:hypothetical protein